MPEDLVRRLVHIGWVAPDDEHRNCWLRVHGDQIFWCGAALSEVLESSALIEVWNGVGRHPTRALWPQAFGGLDAPMVLSADGTKLAQGRRVMETPNGGLAITGRDFASLPDKLGDTVIKVDEFRRTLDRDEVGTLRRTAGFGDGPLLPAILHRFDSTDGLQRFLGEHGIEAQRWPHPGSWGNESELAEIVDRAKDLAAKAHAGQVDKLGAPYIEHPARNAARVRAAGHGEYAEVVAWLHDVVEDTDVTLAEINRDFGSTIAAAVGAITRRDDEGDAYYRRVAANDLARIVKLYDIADNSAPDRTALLGPATRDRLAAKYERALELLDTAGPN